MKRCATILLLGKMNDGVVGEEVGELLKQRECIEHRLTTKHTRHQTYYNVMGHRWSLYKHIPKKQFLLSFAPSLVVAPHRLSPSGRKQNSKRSTHVLYHAMSAALAAAAVETFVPVVTSRQLFEDERTFAEFLHTEEMRLEERQHEAEQRQAQQLHREKLQYDTDLFVHDMRVDIALATRDATRDAIRMCSQVASSVAMCDALLLNCVFLLVSQFNVPTSSPDDVLVADTVRMQYGMALWAALLGASFLALIGSVITCLRLQKVVSAYDIGHHLRRYQPCGQSHSNFNTYFVCHCQVPEQQCRKLCEAGAVLTLLSSGVWAYINFVASGAATDVGTFAMFVFPVGIAVVVFVVGPWALPDRTKPGPREFVGMVSHIAHGHPAAPTDPHAAAAAAAGGCRIKEPF